MDSLVSPSRRLRFSVDFASETVVQSADAEDRKVPSWIFDRKLGLRTVAIEQKSLQLVLLEKQAILD
jgi:hypothetical protein